MRLIIHQALTARITPITMVIIYFFAASVFSSLPWDMIYIIPTRHMPNTAIIAVISCNIMIIDLRFVTTLLTLSGPGSHGFSMFTRLSANIFDCRKNAMTTH